MSNTIKMQIDDSELAQELKDMHISSWETRKYGKGRRKLYIRLEPDLKQFTVNLRRMRTK